MSECKVIQGDCLEVLRGMEDNSVDSVVCDPPYGLSNTKPQQVADVLAAWVTGDTEAVPAKRGGFMGKDWDSFVPPPAVWAECLRVLKPGGHMAVFAGARTQDLMGLSIRLAGFEIRDTLGWIYGSGFPKSMDVSKAIDKTERGSLVRMKMLAAAQNRGIDGKYLEKCGVASAASWADWTIGGHVPSDKNWEIVKDALDITAEEEAEFEREVAGVQRRFNEPSGIVNIGQGERVEIERKITTPATSEAQRWEGWGTALKPAIEPIILARKPLAGTVAANVLEHGVGGLNIDASRVGTDEDTSRTPSMVGDTSAPMGRGIAMGGRGHSAGRFPANVLLDEHAAREMDRQSGVLPGGSFPARRGADKDRSVLGEFKGQDGLTARKTDSGGASRFFPVFKYQAKAPKRERPVVEREDGTKVQHPTVKPVALLDWLVTLTTPPGGLVLDPFAGTGTTLQAARNKGFKAIGIEQDADYIQLINARLENNEETLFPTIN